MLVRNDVRHDARVRREAAALSDEYDVTVFGIDRGTPFAERTAFEVRLMTLPPQPLRRFAGVLSSYSPFLTHAVGALTHHRPDILHAHDLDALLPCAIVARRLRVPLVYDAHELYAEQGRHGRLGELATRAVEDVAMRRVAAILAANESRAGVMWREYRCPVRPIAIVNCPAAAAPVVANAKLRRWVAEQGRHWERIVLYQGLLLGDRHLEELAAAARLLPVNAGMVFIGEGPAAESIRTAGGDRVLLHPLLPIADLLPFIAAADLGVVTYANTCRNNYLCAPNKLFDYVQAGLPIAVGDLPELARLVREFDAGIVFKNGETASMAREIGSLLADDFRLHQARRGAGRLADTFTWETQAQKLLGVYAQIRAAAQPRSS